MLTWPCVIIEWNTPPIHWVVVSDASSGSSLLPVRMIWPCGRKLARSLAGKTTCVSAPVKKESRRSPSLSATECIQLGVVQLGDFEERAGAEERRRRSDAAAVMRRRRSRGLAKAERAIGERDVVGRACAGMIGLEPAEESELGARAGIESHRGVLNHREGVLVLAARTRQAVRSETYGYAAPARRKTVELERVGAKARRVR